MSAYFLNGLGMRLQWRAIYCVYSLSYWCVWVWYNLPHQCACPQWIFSYWRPPRAVSRSLVSPHQIQSHPYHEYLWPFYISWMGRVKRYFTELSRASWPITVHCYKHTHCFQQPLRHTQFGTPCHLVKTVLLTSRTGEEKEEIRYAGRRDNRPTKTPYPCPYRAHCPVVASAAVSKLTWIDGKCWSWITCACSWNGME